jgi:hypothetical protein
MENLKRILWSKYRQENYTFRNHDFREDVFDDLFLGVYPTLKDFFKYYWESQGASIPEGVLKHLNVRQALKDNINSLIVISFVQYIQELKKDDEDYSYINEEWSENPIETAVVFVFKRVHLGRDYYVKSK